MNKRFLILCLFALCCRPGFSQYAFYGKKQEVLYAIALKKLFPDHKYPRHFYVSPSVFVTARSEFGSPDETTDFTRFVKESRFDFIFDIDTNALPTARDKIKTSTLISLKRAKPTSKTCMLFSPVAYADDGAKALVAVTVISKWGSIENLYFFFENSENTWLHLRTEVLTIIN